MKRASNDTTETDPDAKKARNAIEPKVIFEFSPTAKLIEFDLFADPDWMTIIEKVADEAQPQLIRHPKLGKLYGKDMRMQRSVGFFANPKETVGYKFSRQVMKSIPPSEAMVALMAMISELIGSKINGILVNWYENGSEYISPHSDDERGLSDTGVFCISLGADRTFRLRNKATKKILFDTYTRHGTALMMQGCDFQKVMTHEIPKCAAITTPRISITGRHHTE